MMKFLWMGIRRKTDTPIDYWVLFERVGDNGAKFRGDVLCIGDGRYQATVQISGNDCMQCADFLPFTEAKQQVEKKLFDSGIILDGDIINDYTDGDEGETQ